MALLRQRRYRHVGEVVNVDDRFRDPAARHRQHAAEDRVAQVAFREVLREPGRADDGEVHARGSDHLLAQAGMVLAAAGEQHEVVHPDVPGRLAK